MWTITVMDYPRTIHSRGYSATREQAMTDFKAQWLSGQPPLPSPPEQMRDPLQRQTAPYAANSGTILIVNEPG